MYSDGMKNFPFVFGFLSQSTDIRMRLRIRQPSKARDEPLRDAWLSVYRASFHKQMVTLLFSGTEVL